MPDSATSTTSAIACAAPAGRSGRPSTTGRRASRWPTSRRLCATWADDYDWRRVEAELNRYDQLRFVPEVGAPDRLGIQVLHAPSPEPDALPVVFTHGWPGSVVEFLDVIEPLRDPRAHGGDPADAFHVVCPTLPGYGFSDKPTAPGWNVERIADAWAELMTALGYDRFGAQGGDWGRR